MQDYDYIIIGAGASGLMMAYRMSKDSFFDDKSILIIDKEQKTKNDRTWCYWEKGTGYWDDIIKTSWDKIIFKSDSLDIQKDINPYQYKMIRSSDFYNKIWSALKKKNNITFSKEDVRKISQEREFVKVVSVQNEYFSKNVMNSILFTDNYKIQTEYPALQQHFVGFFVKTKKDFFDDSSATFMDFTIAQKGNTRFMYVLPFSKKEALFEYTLFSKELLPYADYRKGIEDYLTGKNINDYQIIEKEQGSIPMTSYKFWKENSKNIINIGTAGGWSKASTGFTFKNIDRNTFKLVAHLKQQKSLNTFYRKTRFWLYDLLLLDILSANNALGSSIFSRMFKNISPQKIFKFLDEKTTFKEDVLIFSKMPLRLFSKALIKRLF